MENVGRNDAHSVARLLIMLATVAAMVVCVVLAFVDAWWWSMIGLTALCVGVSMQPQPQPIPGGRSRQWRLPEGITMAIGFGVLPLGVAATVEWAWWWSVVAVGVMVGAALVANELDKTSGAHSAHR